MAWRDRLSAMFSRRKPKDVDFTKWNSIIQQAENFLSNNDLRSITDILERHRKSNLVVIGICGSIKTWMHKVMATPEDAARSDVLELMAALRKSSFVKKSGRSLASTSIYTNNPVLSTLAMHTFLLNDYLMKNPESKLSKPSMTEVEAALRIVENHFRKEIMWELLNTVFSNGWNLPSRNNASLQGWVDDVDRLQDMHEQLKKTVEPHEIKQLRERMWPIQNRIVRESERILESDPEYPPPPTYLQKLDHDLDALHRIALFPENVTALYNLWFLDKYGIQPDKPLAVRCQQIENSFRGLDNRIVRLTGRKPYADELFASLKRYDPVWADVSMKEDQSSKMRPSELSHPEQPSASRKIRR